MLEVRVNAVLEAVELSVDFEVSGRFLHALAGVNLAVLQGERLALVGESGCGKSTLSRTLLKLENPSHGDIYAFGEKITHLPERALKSLRRRSAFVFQDPISCFNPRFSVGWSVAEPLAIEGKLGRSARHERVVALLQSVGLDPKLAERYPGELSGGQLQRVAIARALALEPEILILDEAVSALDVSVQAGILNLLMELHESRAQKTPCAYLFVSHDLDVVRFIAERVAVMYLGRLVELATSSELFKNPLHPYTKALLSACPVADPNQKIVPEFWDGERPSLFETARACPFLGRCKARQKICETEVPPLREVEPGHFCACFCDN